MINMHTDHHRNIVERETKLPGRVQEFKLKKLIPVKSCPGRVQDFKLKKVIPTK